MKRTPNGRYKKQLPIRNWLLAFLCLLWAETQATTYYISSEGRATNPGTKKNQAWNFARLQQELARQKGGIFWPGDSILLQRGDVFYGQMLVRCSGGPGKPITIGAYGVGAKPVVTGLVALSNWKSIGKNQYEASLPQGVRGSINMVLVNGVNYGQGRFPNSAEPNKGYLANESGLNDNNSFIHSKVQETNWQGATLVARLMHFVLDTAIVVNQQGDRVQTRPFHQKAQKGYGFFFTNHPATIDRHGEWFHNRQDQSLRIQLDAAPTRYTIQVPVVDTLFSCNNQKYLVVQDLVFEGANHFGIYFSWSPNNTIQRCSVRACGIEGIAVSSQGNHFISVLDNTITDCGNFGINARYVRSGATIRGNTIQRIGLLEQNGGFGTICRMGILNSEGSNHSFSYNKLDSCGYVGIRFNGSDVSVHHNLVQHYGMVMDDGGGIYSVNQAGHAQTNRKVYRNIIMDGMDAFAGTPHRESQTYGIYLDDGSKDVELYENFIARSRGSGLFLHNTAHINAHHNTFFDCREAGVRFTYDLAKWDPPVGMYFKYNTIITTGSKSLAIKLLETRDSTFIPKQAFAIGGVNSLPQIDSNIYANPYGESTDIFFAGWHMYQKSKQQTRRYTLKQYSQLYGLDKNSREGTILLDGPQNTEQDFLVLYNATQEPHAYQLKENCMDVKGNIYRPGKISLAPYEGLVLIKAAAQRRKK